MVTTSACLTPTSILRRLTSSSALLRSSAQGVFPRLQLLSSSALPSRNVNSVKIVYFALDRGGSFEHWVKIKNRQHPATTRVFAPRFMPFISLHHGCFVPCFGRKARIEGVKRKRVLRCPRGSTCAHSCS